MSPRSLAIGSVRPLDGRAESTQLALPAHHLATHGVVLGMTGSGKTGLLVAIVEETLRARIPVLMIDVKGDLPDLLLAFPDFAPASFAPWLDPDAAARNGTTVDDTAARLADARREGLLDAGIDEDVLRAFRESIAPRVITPGTHAGEMLHVLSSLERRSARWDTDEEGAHAALSAAVSLLLRLLGRDADPAKSRDHVLLSVLAERRLRAGEHAGLDVLLADLEDPPIAEIGAMALDAFCSKRERRALAASLNALLASPTFASWRQGASLDVGAWLAPRDDGKTPAVIVSVAHLDDEERMLVLGMLLEETLAWVRSLPGSSELKALVVFDEIYGFLPPHPASPPTKRPLVALMKQARGFGVGVMLATQNPMDLDYRALSNAGTWFVGRLPTDADRARVVEALVDGQSVGEGIEQDALEQTLKILAPRWFVMRDVHAEGPSTVLLQARWTMSWLRGPLTRAEIKRVGTVLAF